jgi:hypothetical protein
VCQCAIDQAMTLNPVAHLACCNATCAITTGPIDPTLMIQSGHGDPWTQSLRGSVDNRRLAKPENHCSGGEAATGGPAKMRAKRGPISKKWLCWPTTAAPARGEGFPLQKD